ncbi:hypothetical protein CpipJ_CPIJ009009, partial [Culex quinquefasciatus]
ISSPSGVFLGGLVRITFCQVVNPSVVVDVNINTWSKREILCVDVRGCAREISTTLNKRKSAHCHDTAANVRAWFLLL